MSRKTKITIPHLIFKTAVTVPVIVTGLLQYTGEHILKKSIPFLSEKNNHLPALEQSDKHVYSNTDSKTSPNSDTIFGMRPFGPKIYIRK